jgi:hypothetical protein
MIAVIVRDDQMVDLLHPCNFRHGFDNSVGIAPTRIARIDQHRLTRRRNQQRRRSPFNVDPIKIEPPIGRTSIGSVRANQECNYCQRPKDS